MVDLDTKVSFRNRIVHLYWEIDDLALYHILHENLGDIEVYIQHILDFTKAIGSDSV
jgi:uncharacterized protein YutE (UPF0331/DUF86 family)